MDKTFPGDADVMTYQIILASSSPYRQQLMRQLGLNFTSISPDINESHSNDECVESIVQRLAINKARAVAEKYPDTLIVASDQLASLDGLPLGKPGDHNGAICQLQRCSGRSVTFFTAVCLLSPKSILCDLVTTEVHFRHLTALQIENYLKCEKPYDCAGSFKCEGLGIALFQSIKSTDPTALIGLPLISLNLMLAHAGIDTLSG